MIPILKIKTVPILSTGLIETMNIGQLLNIGRIEMSIRSISILSFELIEILCIDLKLTLGIGSAHP